MRPQNGVEREAHSIVFDVATSISPEHRLTERHGLLCVYLTLLLLFYARPRNGVEREAHSIGNGGMARKGF